MPPRPENNKPLPEAIDDTWQYLTREGVLEDLHIGGNVPSTSYLAIYAKTLHAWHDFFLIAAQATTS